MTNSLFITLEGSEGVGKSTALQFIKNYLTEKKLSYVLTREPGGTTAGEAMRQILLHHEKEALLPETELLLLFAGRAQHITQVIKPVLAENKIVISDRFTDSSFAYQGGGRQVPYDKIEFLENWIQGDCVPDLTLLFDAPTELGLSRLQARNKKDRIERETVAFFERVREAYLMRAKQYPERFVVIHAEKPIEEVRAQIKIILDARL